MGDQNIENKAGSSQMSITAVEAKKEEAVFEASFWMGHIINAAWMKRKTKT